MSEAPERQPGEAVESADARLYRRLVDEHYATVFRYLRWMTGDDATAADLTQDAFERVWRSLPDPQRPESHRAWLLKVASNVLRKQARAHPRGALADLSSEARSAEPPPDWRFERTETDRRVREAVDRLPAPYRAVVTLHNLQDLTLRETADVLGIPVGTAKSRLAVAFEKLRRMLHEEGGEDS